MKAKIEYTESDYKEISNLSTTINGVDKIMLEMESGDRYEITFGDDYIKQDCIIVKALFHNIDVSHYNNRDTVLLQRDIRTLADIPLHTYYILVDCLNEQGMIVHRHQIIRDMRELTDQVLWLARIEAQDKAHDLGKEIPIDLIMVTCITELD